MGESTNISWTDSTWNPWWGCSHAGGPGCDNCYAEAFAHRVGMDLWDKGGERRFFGDSHWNEPVKWDRKAYRDAVRRRVFCASMADVFEDHDTLPPHRQRLWDLIGATPNLDWLLLTKRPQNIAAMVPPSWVDDPPRNAWFGVTVENQRWANLRVPQLLGAFRTRPEVLFLSYEPALERVDLLEAGALAPVVNDAGEEHYAPLVDWVICGGESGPNHRPMDLEWSRYMRDQCKQAGIAYFFKQVGGRTPSAGGHELDGQVLHAWPA